MEKVGKVKKNLNVVITGAARGIGRETVRAFNRVGALVIALDKNENGLRTLSNETGCLTQVCDVTDILSVEAAFKMIMEKGISIDVLVSNAGTAYQSAIGDVPSEVIRQSFELNFFGHQNVCQAAVKHFRSNGRGGTLLFNISNQSVNPGKNFGPYGIPKAATMALMKQYALDHGDEGIRANGVNAGRIRTDLMTTKMINDRAAKRGITPEEYMTGNLLGIEVFASDVAEAFVYLSQMEKVNAAVLTVDGGGMATSVR